MQSHLKGLPSMSAHNIMHLLKTNSQKSHLKGFSPVRVRIYAPSNFQSVKTVIDKSHMFLFSASMSKHYVSSHIQLVNTLIYAYIHLTKKPSIHNSLTHFIMGADVSSNTSFVKTVIHTNGLRRASRQNEYAGDCSNCHSE